MAASAWVVYNFAKEYLMDGTIDLDTQTFDLHLYTSASNAQTATILATGSLSGEVASGNGYTLAGKDLSAVTWGQGASATERRFDCTAKIFSASGGSISNIKTAVIVARTGASAKDPANKVLCYAQLSTAQFTVTDGNTLTLTPSANGIFELN